MSNEARTTLDDRVSAATVDPLNLAGEALNGHASTLRGRFVELKGKVQSLPLGDTRHLEAGSHFCIMPGDTLRVAGCDPALCLADNITVKVFQATAPTIVEGPLLVLPMEPHDPFACQKDVIDYLNGSDCPNFNAAFSIYFLGFFAMTIVTYGWLENSFLAVAGAFAAAFGLGAVVLDMVKRKDRELGRILSQNSHVKHQALQFPHG